MDGTVRDYGARFFFDGKIPNLYFPIQDKGILFALDPLGRSETASLQASIAFATRIFELSGLKDTFPLRQLDLQAESAYPADVKIVNVEPSTLRIDPDGSLTDRHSHAQLRRNRNESA
jgi:hypothetical protein